MSRNYLNSDEFRLYDQRFCEAMDQRAAARKAADDRRYLDAALERIATGIRVAALTTGQFVVWRPDRTRLCATAAEATRVYREMAEGQS